MKILLSFAFSLLFSWHLFAQAQNGWFVEANSGFQAGWWMYNHGTSDPNIFANQGLDYSHFSTFLPFGLAFGKEFGKTKLALGAAYTIYFDNELRRHTNSPSILATYEIADGYPKLVHAFFQIDRVLLQRKNFAVGPFLKAGWFKLLADPPRAWRFGFSYFWQAGLQGSFNLSTGQVFLRPSFQENYIKINEPDLDGAQNKIFSVGVELGYRLALRKPHNN